MFSAPHHAHQKRLLSLQDRCRGGSLPLKKRRVNLDFTQPRSCEAFSPYQKQGLKSPSPEDSPPTMLTALSIVASNLSNESKDGLKSPRAAAAEEASSIRIPSAAGTVSDLSVDGLDQPLPGGCHGKTSRGNAYCKRQPCYKGSKYCKLHYQQYNVKTKKSCKKYSHSPKAPSRVTAAAVSSSSNCIKSMSSSAAAVSTNGGGQDKRFTGERGEVRCLATTTRGRACAYIAVNETKYCFLHSDYDTNPPPRRSAAEVAIVETNTKKKKPADNNLTATKRFRRTSAKLAEKHADSPHPLLSMISTDQWYQKKVKVAVGPLEGRVGLVMKWGNGWVSVKIPGIGLHNRRSFELYLQDKQEEKKDDPAIFRCVSRDVVSPSPSASDNSARSSSRSSSSRALTPNLYKPSDETIVRKFQAIPETPRPLLTSIVETTPVPMKATVQASKVTPFTPAKTMASLCSARAAGLQLPDNDIAASTDMVFRPSVGERTRARCSSIDALKDLPLPKKRSSSYQPED